MNVNVTASADNKLLDRKEIEAEVSFDGATPKREEIKAAVCQKVGVNPDITVLRKVENSFGTKSVKVIAYSYSSEEALEATEPDYIKSREGMKKEEKAEEAAPAAAPKPEEKKEEPKKEAPKAEEKKEEKPAEKKAEEKPEKKEEKKEAPPEKKEEAKEEKKEAPAEKKEPKKE